jgi:hypothetical protein
VLLDLKRQIASLASVGARGLLKGKSGGTKTVNNWSGNEILKEISMSLSKIR